MERVLTVSQLNEYVRRSLAGDPMLKGIRLRGEISNFKRHTAGHLYFTLKDEEARVACVMFRSAASSLGIMPGDGMRVVAAGSAALYAPAGQYQFYVDSLRDDGVGERYAALEKLKRKLEAEGLFDPSLKKPLPLLPRGVGVVTSPTGAVVHDIQQVALRRHPGVQLILRPSAVQGEGAAEDIAAGIAALDSREDIDVIIVGRGGGSLEELWAFNEETVARAIFRAKTPVISAVGHETDFTIADFAADARAATPSQAAELAVPSLAELKALVGGLAQRLARGQAQRLALHRHRLDALTAKLSARQPMARIGERRAGINALLELLTARAGAAVAGRRHGLLSLKGRLEALSPGRALARGYALVTAEDGSLLTDAARAAPGDGIRVLLKRGALGAVIREVDNGEE